MKPPFTSKSRKPKPEAFLPYLLTFADVAYHCRCSYGQARELVHRKCFELVDIGPRNGSRHVWRVMRRSFEKFIDSRKVKQKPKGQWGC